MKPTKSILDSSFIYVPSAATSVDQTWRRFGWKPLSEEGRTDASQIAATSHSPESLSRPAVS